MNISIWRHIQWYQLRSFFFCRRIFKPLDYMQIFGSAFRSSRYQTHKRTLNLTITNIWDPFVGRLKEQEMKKNNGDLGRIFLLYVRLDWRRTRADGVTARLRRWCDVELEHMWDDGVKSTLSSAVDSSPGSLQSFVTSESSYSSTPLSSSYVFCWSNMKNKW